MAQGEADAGRKRRTAVVGAALLLLLFGLIATLPIFAAVTRGGVNLGAVLITAEVYDEPSRRSPFVLHRRLQGPDELAEMFDSAAPPEMPWSAGREVQLSCFGWTYRAHLIYPGAYVRESERRLHDRKFGYRYQR